MKPVKLYENQKPVICAHCGENLLEKPEMSIVVFVQDLAADRILDIYTCCKGECDHTLRKERVCKNSSDGWKELTEFTNPLLFLKHILAVMNNMHGELKINDEAFENYKQLILSMAPYVMRETKEKELESAINDAIFPF